MNKKDQEIEPKVPVTKQALFRMGIALIVLLSVFAIARQMAVPAAFGEYGRYRGDSVAENANREVSFAASGQICAGCHNDVAKTVASAQHGQMDCQTCHGPAAAHPENPAAWQPKIDQPTELCKSCHTATEGRTNQLATVEPQGHSGGMDCLKCHDQHSPYAKLRG